MTLAQKMKNEWEKVNPRGVHFGISGEKEEMFARYKKYITDEIKVDGKTIIDYGCGGALLGLYLLSNFDIKKYIAYDLAEQSIRKAKENLAPFENKELNLVVRHSWDFAEKKPDIIVCLACMIHFPTQIYLDNFLKQCNNSGAKNLVLEIRDIGKGTRFQKEIYKDRGALTKACFTDLGYVSAKLTNYKHIRSSEKFASNCIILTYKIKKSTIET
jgi:2-polyprenyl-3-methyl-5-hydroxy-6-metoxy-1,4-benzoquinol methylase